MAQRFTIDGSTELEARLGTICEQSLQGVQAIVPAQKLEALVLAGGYGRGEGGVLRTGTSDEPYNDLEFYLFLRGNRLLNERRYHARLAHLAERLSLQAGVEVEFKSDSLARLRASASTMFSYDLVSRHRIVFGPRDCFAFGPKDCFAGCEHHLNAATLPMAEATRLLCNRCTGLLLARELLSRGSLTRQDSDFIGRNLAKAKLAFGDALLVAFGQYHWSCLERMRRLMTLVVAEPVPGLDQVRRYHAEGVEFKLHPQRIALPLSQLAASHREVSALASELWLWLERRRLGKPFASLKDYALHATAKCPENKGWRNVGLTLRKFGLRGLSGSMAWRYPRERLLNSLPLLLWTGETETSERRHLQRQLETDAADWTGLVAAYKKCWVGYG